MIQYLQHLKAKKGFTLIELIVVIAIIAVLIAVILPNVGTKKEKIQAANMRATDFYSGVQYCFTKFMKYESNLSVDLKSEETLIKYSKEANGNYPVNKYTYIEMYVEGSVIRHVRAADNISDIFDHSSATGNTFFEMLMLNEIESVLDVEVDGYYYALIDYTSYTGMSGSTIPSSVRVHSAYYCEDEFPPVTGSPSDYRDAQLLFREDNVLANGYIVGVSTSRECATGQTVGMAGSYFMDLDSTLANA